MTPWGAAGGDYDAIPVASATITGNTEYQWSSAALTTLVDKWKKGMVNNYGLLLGSKNLGSNDRFFAAEEYGVAGDRPRLYVEYKLP
jgi:hypothetical protein